MFTDLLDLPIDRDRAQQQDQTLTLSGMTWADYEQLVNEDYLGYRVSYWQGNITIVSPSSNHERIAETINGLVKTYCRKQNLVYFPIGSTTLKNPPLAGKEPDCSFAFHADKSIPDLAVEVTYSSGGTVDLGKYQSLGVKEVWFWQNNKITFYGLGDSDYVEISQSFCLPQLAANFLLVFVNRGLTESPLTIEADFYQAV